MSATWQKKWRLLVARRDLDAKKRTQKLCAHYANLLALVRVGRWPSRSRSCARTNAPQGRFMRSTRAGSSIFCLRSNISIPLRSLVAASSPVRSARHVPGFEPRTRCIFRQGLALARRRRRRPRWEAMTFRMKFYVLQREANGPRFGTCSH